MKEIWKDIPGYEDLYQISNYGIVKNKKRNTIKKQTLFKGYYVTKLGKYKVKPTHRLVAMTFLDKSNFKYAIDEDPNYIIKEELVVNHKDENKLNNRVDNLEWCTNKYNTIYSYNSPYNRLNKIIEYLNNNKVDEQIKIEILNIINSQERS